MTWVERVRVSPPWGASYLLDDQAATFLGVTWDSRGLALQPPGWGDRALQRWARPPWRALWSLWQCGHSPAHAEGGGHQV